MNKIYLDNAATSFPKAPGVIEAITHYIAAIGSNVNRNVSKAYEAEFAVYHTREMLCELFNYNKPQNVIFTKNITESLNLIIKGLLCTGDHVIVSPLEHNAVMRPLNSLAKHGICYSRFCCSPEGDADIESITREIRPNTKAIITTHASNVSGHIFPLAKIGEICQKYGLFFIADAAQSAGCLEIDLEGMQIDALAFTGHKSLLGPQGIGGIVFKDALAEKIPPFIEGGTGSFSEFEEQPLYLPDKFESGTLNLPGIYGLNASLKHLLKTGVNNIFEHEFSLVSSFMEKLLNIEGIKILGPHFEKKRAPLVSVDFCNRDNAEIANRLLSDHNIITRVGLHCAPNAHKTLGTFSTGAVRFSFSSFNTEKEVAAAIDAIQALLKQ